VRLSSENVGEYLVGRGVLTEATALEIEELTGGVACMVFAVRGEGKRVVVKQALERFRVADEWLVPPERAVTEARALELMAQLAPGSVPPPAGAGSSSSPRPRHGEPEQRALFATRQSDGGGGGFACGVPR
jgi:hypothetical protein